MHKLYEEAKRLIPGGSNLFSKRGELHAPDSWPQYYQSAKGIVITDLEGRQYRDFSGAGVGACILGFADPDVDAAVIGAINRGSTSALLAPEEVELARLLTLLHPWASACRFTRSGGEAMAVAIRIAQAKTGRLNVYHTRSYHGWHVNDPRTGDRFLPFNGQEPLAAIIVEPARLTDPEPGQLERWRKLADANGAVLIFDEISSGFRRNLGGVHLHYGVAPDIAVFSKAMSNGYPMGAVVGTEAVMAAANDTFISSTSWSERIGPVAAIATIQKLWANDVFDHIKFIGELVQRTLADQSSYTKVKLTLSGPPSMLHVNFEDPTEQTLYTQLMLDNGILAGRDFYPSYSHTIEDCEVFLEAAKHVFPQLHDHSLLRGSVVESGVNRIR